MGSSPQGWEVRGGKCGAGEEVGCLRGQMHPCWMRSRKTGWNEGGRREERKLSPLIDSGIGQVQKTLGS